MSRTIVALAAMSLTLAIASPLLAQNAEPDAERTNWRLVGGATALGIGTGFMFTGVVGAVKVKSIQDDAVMQRYLRATPTTANGCDRAATDTSSDALAVRGLCSKATTWEAVEVTMFSLGALTSALGVVLLATSHRSPKRAAARIDLAPHVGPRIAALDVTYRF